MILKHLNKENLHHAYLIEGEKEEIEGEVIKFIEELGIKTSNNSDFCHISVDSFKIEDARNLKSFSREKSVSAQKKIFLISINNFVLAAQNSLLKMFEEPIENTHFFLIMPDASLLLKTLASRFYLISTKQNLIEESQNVEKFIFMSLEDRIIFIKNLLKEVDDEDEEVISQKSVRFRALRFLNALELVLHNKLQNNFLKNSPEVYFSHFFKVRQFLNQPGSSVKSLMESVALITPNF